MHVLRELRETIFASICPYCQGKLIRRPIRPAAMLAKNPASTVRHVRAQPCTT
jgi:uncharacterized protein